MAPVPPTRPTGFSLVEITLALGVVSFALLSLVGLTMVGMQRSTDSRKLQEAAELANRFLQMRRSAPTANAPNTLFDPAVFPIPPLTNSLSTQTNSQTNYLTASGAKVASATAPGAVYGLATSIALQTNSLIPVRITLEMFWPPGATNSTRQSYYLATEILNP